MHDILITADNLSYKINENRLFSGVSFSFEKRVSVCILRALMARANQHYLELFLE